MEKYKSKLRFNKYVVNEVNFKNNDNFKPQPVTIDFSIYKNIEREENNMKVELVTKVFENAEENNFPFEMIVKLTGYFTEENNDENINFEPNAIAILYPYVRSIVSIYTINSNVNGLILPVINVNNVIKDLDSKKGN
ncbi:MAG TPA: protein-export chaperone SecB [Clostridiaceae bacterium]|nr:protein-export chaperone SecB [Clostridium sp.]HJJ11745.1 protein-export chaperone SecB [Clostridiaceae bacterium]